ncbi:glycolipid 2-alpha-mannosyltransferase-domain-containing protein [Dichotomocladium elegans]|nr:glycolipid 2-alpha-mannosyltransferase-domain-containing protein [Dichotomocladium elegans]
MRQIIQMVALGGMILVLYHFSRGTSALDPRDLDFVQALCNGQQQKQGKDELHPVAVHESEYDRAWHLRPIFAPDTRLPIDTWDHLPVRGALYMMVRNEALQDARTAMRSVEDRFNKHFRYPWVLLNNQDFTPTFIKYVRMVTDAPVYFGKVDLAAWEYPSWIDVSLAEAKMHEMSMMDLHMAGSASFRQMLRYQSGLFIHHPLFDYVDYIWRVEPGSSYSCDMESDPFRFMYEHNKTLGFTLTMRESKNAIPSLWSASCAFMQEHPEMVMQANATIMPWITDSDRTEYNTCHLWSNFEIIETAFLRSREYQAYFSHLDHQGGFFYER